MRQGTGYAPKLEWRKKLGSMSIDVGSLEEKLMRMATDEAPGREFCEVISKLAGTGRFAKLRDALPEIVYDEL